MHHTALWIPHSCWIVYALYVQNLDGGMMEGTHYKHNENAFPHGVSNSNFRQSHNRNADTRQRYCYGQLYLDGAPPIFSPLILCSGFIVPARYIGSVWQDQQNMENETNTKLSRSTIKPGLRKLYRKLFIHFDEEKKNQLLYVS